MAWMWFVPPRLDMLKFNPYYEVLRGWKLTMCFQVGTL
jgi:hypothetical protein